MLDQSTESPPFNSGNDTAGATATLPAEGADSRGKFTTGAAGVSLGMSAAAYERITDVAGWTMAMGSLIHKSAMFGVINPEQGAIVAFDCYVRRVPPLTWASTYHIVENKISMRADAMLARFREAGGRVDWKEMGEDGQKATAKFTVDGKNYSIGYTIEDAQRAGLVTGKPGSNWQKRPGEMLRARLISKAIRMLMPEVISGVYCPEEIMDETEASQRGVTSRLLPDTTNLVPVENTEKVSRITAIPTTAIQTTAVPVLPAPAAATAAEAKPDTPVPGPAPSKPVDYPLQNGSSHPSVVSAVNEATAAAPAKVQVSQLAKIKELKELLGLPDDKYKEIIAKRNVTTARDLSSEQAAELIGKLQDLLNKRMDKARAEGKLNMDTRQLAEIHGMTPEQAQMGQQLTDWANGTLAPNPDRQRSVTQAG